MGRYGLTDEEQARLDAVPWPHKMYVADQLGEERRERESAATAAESTRRYEESLAYAAHTRRCADEETRKHFAGQACDAMFCRATGHLPLWHAALGDGALCGQLRDGDYTLADWAGVDCLDCTDAR